MILCIHTAWWNKTQYNTEGLGKRNEKFRGRDVHGVPIHTARSPLLWGDLGATRDNLQLARDTEMSIMNGEVFMAL